MVIQLFNRSKQKKATRPLRGKSNGKTPFTDETGTQLKKADSVIN